MGKKENKKKAFHLVLFPSCLAWFMNFLQPLTIFFFSSRDNGRSVITSADYRTSRMTNEDSLKKFVSAAIGKVE